jgi:bacteriocin-like protein
MMMITPQELRPLTDEELNTVSGGIDAIFYSRGTVVIISADANHYKVETASPTFCQTTVGSVGR